MRKVFFILIILLLLAIAGIVGYLKLTYPQTSLMKTLTYFGEHLLLPHAKLDKHVLGFLPYWRTEDISSIRLNILSEVNYFGLTVDSNGTIIKQTTTTQTDPGFREWNTESMKDFITKADIMGTDVSITIISQQNDVIESILDSQTAQTTLISQIIEQVKTRHLDGVNIDFEYLGEVDKVYQRKFTTFIQELSTKLKKETPKVTLDISIMPRAARDPELFDFPKLVPYVNRFIGMSYDYYGISSDIAGPNAPMKGFKENNYFFDVTTTYEDYLKFIPKNKILMGIPYYGWDRTVEEGKKINSLTFSQSDPNNYAAVISYARLRQQKDFKPNQCQWDDIAEETWCWYTKDNLDHQVWLADEKSIGIRMDYANLQNFNGIAIWVLGYDKGYSDLWDMMKKKFKK